MKSCDFCKAENPKEAKFCRNCGKAFVPTDLSENTEQRDARLAGTSAEESKQATSSPPEVRRDSASTTTQPLQTPAPTYSPSNPGPVVAPADASSLPPYGQQRAQPPVQMPVAVPVQPNAFMLMIHWLWDSFTHPSRLQRIPSWWPIVPIALNALVIASTTYAMLSHQYRSMSNLTQGINSFFSDIDSSYSVATSIPVTQLFKTAVLMLVLEYAVILMTYAGIRIMGDTSVTFSALHQEIGQKLTTLLAPNLMALVSALIGLNAFAIFLLTVSMLFILVLPAARLAVASNHRKLDRTWMWGLTTLLAGVAIAVVILILIIGGAAEAIGSLF
ncbi:MAG: hypothetical protein ACFWT0_02445 [Bifidobacterium crudilactis]|jgi:hypothetical protein